MATTQSASRQTVAAVDKIGVSIPIVMSDTEGRIRAEQSLYSSWVARTLYEFTLPPKYAYLEAGDVITLNINNINHVIRINSTGYGRAGIQQVKGLAEDISTYDFYVEPGQTSANVTAGSLISATEMEFLDLPYLPTDNSNSGALRLAVTATGENWRGCVIYRSDDGGELGGNNYNVIESTDSEAIMGTVLTDIGNGPNNMWDDANQIEVVILAGELQSTTELGLLNGANACICGDEIIQFQNAELIAANKYRLSKLLRGRQGTEHHINNHQIGERFIYLDSAVINNDIALNNIGLLKYYKAVTVSDSLANTAEQSFTYQGNKLKPL